MLNMAIVIGMLFVAQNPAKNVVSRIKSISSRIQEYQAKGQIEKINDLVSGVSKTKNIPYYTIEGKIYDTGQQPIIAGCYVYIYDAYSGNLLATLYPDISGEYIDTLPKGAYIIQAQGDMYPTIYYTSSGGTELPDSAEILWLTENKDSINITIPDGNVIKGILYDDSTSTPITNIYGSVLLIDTTTKTTFWKPLSTDGSGNYTIEGINKGSFKVKYYVTNYVNTYYGNTTNWFSAQVLTFSNWGDTLSNIDVYLEPTGSGTSPGTGVIRGLLISDTGDTVKDPWPYAIVFDANTNSYVYGYFNYDTTTGIYTISELSTGNYKVRIDPEEYLPQFYNDKNSIYDADPISVTDGDTTDNINFNFHKGGAIAGQITGTDGYGYTGAYYLEVYDANTGEYIYSVFSSTPNGDFASGADLPTGTFKSYLYPTDIGRGQWYKDAYTFETGDTISVTVPDTTFGINFDFYGWTGIISGTVTDVNGDTIDAYVDVYLGDVNEFFASTSTTNGQFIIQNLAPSSYVLHIQPQGNDTLYSLHMNQWYNGQDSWESATRITLNPGDSIDISVVLEKGGRFIGSVIDSTTGKRIISRQFSVILINNNTGKISTCDFSDYGTYRSEVLFPDLYSVLLIPLSYHDTFSYGYASYNPYHFEFYNESTNFSGATSLNLQADSIVLCDFTTTEVNGAIEGYVMNGSNPITGEEYNVIAVNSEGYPVSVFFTRDTAGYHVGGLIPGDYYLYLHPYGLWFNQVYAPIDIYTVPYSIPSGAQPVHVTTSTITDINFDITGISEQRQSLNSIPKINTILKGNTLLISNANTVKTIRIFDISGREIYTTSNLNAQKRVVIPVKDMESGVYFILMKMENGESSAHKILKLR